MKILSKYKDFYDYLSGLYGVDEKIVLDRREFSTPSYLIDKDGVRLTLYICDWICDGYHKNGEFYWGERLKLVAEPNPEDRNKYIFQYNQSKIQNVPSVYIKPKFYSYRDNNNYNLIPYRYTTFYNTKENCPIMIEYGSKTPYKYPKLMEADVKQIFSPKEIYLMLAEWLAPKDTSTDNRTDKEKIISNGFDLKDSFRNTK